MSDWKPTPQQRWHWTWEDPRWDRIAPSWFLTAWKWIGCNLLFGHMPISDQCNIPDHDYCGWCGKSMPRMAERVREET